MKKLNTMIALVVATIFSTTVSAQYIAGNFTPKDRNVIVVNTPPVKVIKNGNPGWNNDKKMGGMNDNRRNDNFKHHRKGNCNHHPGWKKGMHSHSNNGHFDKKR